MIVVMVVVMMVIVVMRMVVIVAGHGNLQCVTSVHCATVRESG